MKLSLRQNDDFRRVTPDQYRDTGQKNKVIKITNIEVIFSLRLKTSRLIKSEQHKHIQKVNKRL